MTSGMLNNIHVFLTILSNSAEKFVSSVQQFSETDTNEHLLKKINLYSISKGLFFAQNIPLASAITRKRHTMDSVLPVFVFVAVLDVSCFSKYNWKLAGLISSPRNFFILR